MVSNHLSKAHLRIARPTDNLAALIPFYRDGLGFDVLFEFSGHDGFDGVMMGHAESAYHLEFTHKSGDCVGRAPSEDNLLVFYLPEFADWQFAVNRMESAGFQSVKALNPYWDVHGRTYEDSDGYRIVLQRAAWPT